MGNKPSAPDSELRKAVKDQNWNTVLRLLEERDLEFTEEERTRAVNAFVTKAPQSLQVDIIPYCNGKILSQETNRKHWEMVGRILENVPVSEAQKRRALVKASKRANPVDFERYILPHCSDHDQLNDVLTHLVDRDLWQIVDKVLEKGVSDLHLRRAVKWASKKADNGDFERYIMPHCSGEQLDGAVPHLVARKLWCLVGKVLEEGVGETQRRYAVKEASTKAGDDDFEKYILQHWTEVMGDALTNLVTRSLKKSLITMLDDVAGLTRVKVIQTVVEKALEDELITVVILSRCKNKQEMANVVLPELVKHGRWDLVNTTVHDSIVAAIKHWTASLEPPPYGTEESKDESFWMMFEHCHVDTSRAADIAEALAKNVQDTVGGFPTRIDHDDAEILFKSTLLVLCCVICSWLTQDLKCNDKQVVSNVYEKLFGNKPLAAFRGIEEMGHVSRKDEKNLLVILAEHPIPLLAEASSVALRVLLRHQRWVAISHVCPQCFCHAWEQVRRDLFKAAVERGRWDIVKQWAGHTVLDNQRWWALQEAYKHKQWKVMLLLADHGLTTPELMWVRYRLAMYADWDVVLQMFERGVDVTEVREVVESNMKARKTVRDPVKRQALERRWKRLLAAEKKFIGALYGKREGESNTANDSGPSGQVTTLTRRQAKVKALKAAKLGKWCLVFFHFHRHLKNHCLQEALKMALEKQAWHVVIQLVRLLRMDTAKRDSFFTEMLRLRKWAVCRALLDQGLSVQLCLDVLPQLMEMDQWSLVARVMEFNVDDEVRKDVLYRAMERREGSVVWRCISTMQHYRLPVDEREKLFQQAFSRGVWQAIKPLVEEKDSTGIQHRDTALLAAIEQHQWDVVDYCQHYHADIDMKDDRGETPLNRAATKKDWRAVRELVVRGSNTNLHDMLGDSVLSTTITAKQWDTVKLVIEFHGDIHRNDKTPFLTPLQMLISHQQGEIINHTLMWCPEQPKGINKDGETTLHAIALGEEPDFLYYQVVRGVNPLSVTKKGQSVLVYAVKNVHCPQRMVAECIKLGFSTHQQEVSKQMSADVVQLMLGYADDSTIARLDMKSSVLVGGIKSPFMLSILKGLPVLAHMLYESGSCSNTELYCVHDFLRAMALPFTKEGRREEAETNWKLTRGHIRLLQNVEAFLPILKEMATTPRKLKSLCRLVISHCLNVHRRYHRDVQRLPVLENEIEMKNYLMFSDLTDPNYS